MRIPSIPWPPVLVVRALLSLVVACIAGWQLAPWLTLDATSLISAGHVKDDAFFYSVLVENYREHGFFTLDGTIPTNGFQPLWMGLLLILDGLVADLPAFELLRQLSWFSYVLFCIAATWLVSVGGRWQALVRVGVLAPALLLNRRFQDVVVEGLEPPLALALLSLALIAFGPLTRRLRDGEATARRQLTAAATLGLLGALVFFARTDLFWLTGLLGLWVWWCTGRRIVPAAVTGAVALVMVAPYLIWNLTEHGSLVPISGRVKVFLMDSFFETHGGSYWDSEQWRGVISLFGTWLPKVSRSASVFLSYGLVVASLGFVFGPRGRRDLPDVYRLLGALVVLHLLYMQFVYREIRPYTNYYFAPEFLFVVLSIGAWFATLAPRVGTAVLIVALMTASQASWSQLDTSPRSYWTQRLALSKDLQKVADGALVGSFWPGTLAGTTGLNVVPLDGIIGSNTYFEEVVKPGRELPYAFERGVRYIVVNGKPKAFMKARKPVPNRWSTTDQLKLWEHRDRLRVVKRRGTWTLLEVLDAAPPG